MSDEERKATAKLARLEARRDIHMYLWLLELIPPVLLKLAMSLRRALTRDWIASDLLEREDGGDE